MCQSAHQETGCGTLLLHLTYQKSRAVDWPKDWLTGCINEAKERFCR
jgi:hypothetical protein